MITAATVKAKNVFNRKTFLNTPKNHAHLAAWTPRQWADENLPPTPSPVNWRPDITGTPNHGRFVHFSEPQAGSPSIRITTKTISLNTMEVLKKFVGRRNMVANEEVCFMRKMGARSTNLYRPPAVVTSTAFDDDDVFQAVARAMFIRYEVEGLSERDAINATLSTLEDKRGFMESLDLRSANMYSNCSEHEMETSALFEIVEMIRATFGETLKLLWRESITGYDRQSSGNLVEDDMVTDDDNDYRYPLKTPKNLHSPIRVVLSESTYPRETNCTIKPKSSGRQRRRFFPDITEPPRCRSRIRLDFKLPGGEQVKSLQLDGQSMPSLVGYAPPSPISTANQRASQVQG